MVKAYDTRGEGAASALASATTAPAAPSGVSLVREGTSATISFDNPADPFSGETRFQVRVSTTGTNSPAAVESAKGASTVTVNGLDPSESYSFSLVPSVLTAPRRLTSSTVRPVHRSARRCRHDRR